MEQLQSDEETAALRAQLEGACAAAAMETDARSHAEARVHALESGLAHAEAAAATALQVSASPALESRTCS